MELSKLLYNYTSSPKLKARLLVELTLSDGTEYPIGTISDLLIDKDNGTYHFEANHSACTVSRDEIEFI